MPYVTDYDNGVLALRRNNTVYVFFLNIPMEIDANAGRFRANKTTFHFPASCRVRSATWLDSGEPVTVEHDDTGFFIQPTAFNYGTNFIVRIAACDTETG